MNFHAQKSMKEKLWEAIFLQTVLLKVYVYVTICWNFTILIFHFDVAASLCLKSGKV